ncbi:MAG TPA: diguanylate cyclase [Magnetospirillum sp.]|nr:diguanylate cyclase [Magnetospirillum sp.]
MTEPFLFANEIAAAPQADAPTERHWPLLIVDDDPEVHSVTRLALSKIRYKHRPLEFLSAYSAAEAEAILGERRDVAVVLLDVVMETDDAGLRLVRRIRDHLGNKAIRIILRTGQPGQAPEERVIVDYDINDYKSKTELTAQKLFTTIIASLRAFEDITALETGRRGLQQIIETSDSLFRVQSMKHFAAGVLTQLATFIGVEPAGILCAQRGDLGGGDRDRMYVLAAAGPYEPAINQPLADAVPDARIPRLVSRCHAERTSIHEAPMLALFIPAVNELSRDVVACVETDQPLDDLDRQLLEVFASKLSVGFANVDLVERLREANATLEARVEARTSELAEANARLEKVAAQDPLTGAYNRRHFRTLAAQATATARRQNRPVSVLMIDLDHFKEINDTHGHAAGDETLKVLVKLCHATLREGDILARYGGEEFCVLLPETELATAAQVAERLRRAVADTRIDGPMACFTLTASIGVAAWDQGDSNIEPALNRADQALYQAKKGGRDRVVVAEDAA